MSRTAAAGDMLKAAARSDAETSLRASLDRDSQEIHLELGGDWSEKTIGTNGIGTALKTGKPAYVHATEHFAEGVQAWTCAGAPIFDPFTQTIIGVVDLSGPPQIFRQHNVALVLAAAREIEMPDAPRRRPPKAKNSAYCKRGGAPRRAGRHQSTNLIRRSASPPPM